MRLCFIACLVATILLVSLKIVSGNRFNVGDHLDPEDAWNLYNHIKRPPSSGILLSGKELKMR